MFLYLRYTSRFPMSESVGQEKHDCTDLPVRDEIAQAQFDQRVCNAEDKFNCVCIVMCLVFFPLEFFYWIVSKHEE